MFTDRLLVFLGGLVAPLAGLGVRASRRNRLLGRIRTYTELADDLEPKDAASAAVLRQLVSETVQRLATTDRAALARKFDAGTFIAFLLFLSPSVVGFVVSLPPQAWWDWFVLGLSAAWTLIVIAALWESITSPGSEAQTEPA
jgi:hypothetical protein